MNQEEIEINGLISNVVEAENPLDDQVQILLGLDHDILIHADKILLSNVIRKILRDSIKSTESGHIKVESFVAHEQNVLIIRIFDTGKGIPANELPTIFEKKDDDKKDDEFSLNWCKEVIGEHGGNISAKNNEKGGSTFSITLPIKQIDKKNS